MSRAAELGTGWCWSPRATEAGWSALHDTLAIDPMGRAGPFVQTLVALEAATGRAIDRQPVRLRDSGRIMPTSPLFQLPDGTLISYERRGAGEPLLSLARIDGSGVELRRHEASRGFAEYEAIAATWARPVPVIDALGVERLAARARSLQQRLRKLVPGRAGPAPAVRVGRDETARRIARLEE